MAADELLLRLLLFGRAGPAQERADARFELEDIEGLGQVVVRAVLKAEELVHVFGFCS